MINKLAEIKLGPNGGFKGPGIIGDVTSAARAGELFNKFISSVIGIMSVVAFIWFIFLLIGGAISIMSAGGDKAAMESAKKRITSGILGLVVVVAALFIIDLIGAILGIPEILNPANLIQKISPGGTQ